ncbi:MAG TPA: cation diffusion facilitator family transporter [Vicinamibacterales bacterium]|nr:cation diffusion facilitator family transporter [Vicinamibacterales bacterium]
MTATDDAYRTAHRIAAIGIGTSALLAATNIVAGIVAHSTSVTAAGFEFAGDVLASSVVLVGVRVASRPADANHPYGHGRVETLAAFVVGVILAVGGLLISHRSLQAIGEAHAPPGMIAAAALLVAIVLRAIMFAVKLRVGRRILSAALVADAWNDAVDILSALGALTAVALATYNPDRFLAADHYGGFMVGIVVILTGVRVVRDASMDLVDTMPSDDLTRQIAGVARSVPGVAGVEKLFARKTGLQYHVDIHVEVDPSMSVADSHDIATAVRATLTRELLWVADVLVHIEPANLGSGAGAAGRARTPLGSDPRTL